MAKKSNGELSPERRALLQRIASISGKIGSHKRCSQPGYNGKEATAKAQAAFWAKLMAEVDPDEQMAPDERMVAAKHLWKSKMLQGQLKRAQNQLKKVS